MAGVDLIPASYRAAYRARMALRRMAVLLGACAAVGAVAGGAIAWQLRAERARLADLQSGQPAVGALRQQVEALTARKRAREQTRAALAMLRAQRELPLLLAALEGAIDNGVWLTSLRFEHLLRQSGPAAADAPAMDGMRSLRIGQDGKDWLLGNRVEISGGATSQAQLTRFMDVLAAQEGIAAVRLLSSSVKRSESGALVEFSAEATLGESGRRQ